ncbi:MAG: TRAP transporter large permease [Paracoccaceae bacterium]
MEPLDIGLWVTGGLLVLVVLGMRVAFAAALAGLVGLIWIFWARKGYAGDELLWAVEVAAKTAGQVPHSKVASQSLSLIPTFILIGYLAYYAGLTRALFEAAKRWVGWLPGGLAVSSVFATAGFAAVSGASVATAAVFARIAIPEMLKIGYDKRFAAGVVAAGGTLASLIPPSAILVIYAIIVEQDVGKLLLAGFVPGVFSAFVYGAIIVTLAMVWKRLGPPVGGFTWGQRFASLLPAFPIFFVVIIILFFVYNPIPAEVQAFGRTIPIPFGGDAWGTPTEGGALGAFVVFLMAVWQGMRWPELRLALLETAKLSAMIFAIIWGVLIYVRFLGFADLPGAFSDWIQSLTMSPMLILVCILLAYAVLGMFMDAIGMLLLTLPVVYPAVMALNGGPNVAAADATFGMSGPMCAVWFGILVVKMAEFCLITPPIGLNCFVVAGVRDDISVGDVFRGVTPFFIADALTIAALVAFPSIVLWLPRLAAG